MRQAKQRTLLFTVGNNLGLCMLVSKVRGEGILRSYGGHHGTDLDSKLQGFNGSKFQSIHPDGYLEIHNKITQHNDRSVWNDDKDKTQQAIAIKIVADFYNCNEIKELSLNDFFKLIET